MSDDKGLTCLYCHQKPCGCTFCGYCDIRIQPGSEVVGVEDPDPSRALWHAACRKMWQYDQELAAKMDHKA